MSTLSSQRPNLFGPVPLVGCPGQRRPRLGYPAFVFRRKFLNGHNERIGLTNRKQGMAPLLENLGAYEQYSPHLFYGSQCQESLRVILPWVPPDTSGSIMSQSGALIDEAGVHWNEDFQMSLAELRVAVQNLHRVSEHHRMRGIHLPGVALHPDWVYALKWPGQKRARHHVIFIVPPRGEEKGGRAS